MAVHATPWARNCITKSSHTLIYVPLKSRYESFLWISGHSSTQGSKTTFFSLFNPWAITPQTSKLQMTGFETPEELSASQKHSDSPRVSSRSSTVPPSPEKTPQAYYWCRGKQNRFEHTALTAASALPRLALDRRPSCCCFRCPSSTGSPSPCCPSVTDARAATLPCSNRLSPRPNHTAASRAGLSRHRLGCQARSGLPWAGSSRLQPVSAGSSRSQLVL